MAIGVNDEQLGQLTTLSYATYTPGSPAPTIGTPNIIGTLVSIEGPGTTVDEVETPLLSSVIKLFAAGLPGTEMTANIRHNGTNPATIALRAAIKQYPVPSYQWVVNYPDGTSDTFVGFPKGYTVSGIDGPNPVMAAIPIRATSTLASA